MAPITRRSFLGMSVAAPFLSNLYLQPAAAAREAYEGRVLIVVRLMGGNDGLNTVVPIRSDDYYRVRPTIAIPPSATLALPGGDAGLHPSLREFHALMEAGYAGIVQGVGYPQASRSHVRATEIWETGSIESQAPETGWLGRHLDACSCAATPVSGIQFADSAARTLAGRGDHSRLIGHPEALLQLDAARLAKAGAQLPPLPQFAAVERSNRALLDTARQMQRASKGSGARFKYPDSEFGAALRWTGNMIETECPTQVYYLRAGSFENGASSFDTHIDQLATHEQLYAELGSGLGALAAHLRARNAFSRVTLITFSDFGRQLAENRTRGTEHGEASVLFYAGGSVHAGLKGRMPDLTDLSEGGLRYDVDFRAIYADLLTRWLDGDAAILGDGDFGAFPLVRLA